MRTELALEGVDQKKAVAALNAKLRRAYREPAHKTKYLLVGGPLDTESLFLVSPTSATFEIGERRGQYVRALDLPEGPYKATAYAVVNAARPHNWKPWQSEPDILFWKEV